MAVHFDTSRYTRYDIVSLWFVKSGGIWQVDGVIVGFAPVGCSVGLIPVGYSVGLTPVGYPVC